MGTLDFTIKVKEDYSRIGWLYQTDVTEEKGEKFVQEMEKFEIDKTRLTELYKSMILIKEVVSLK